MKVQAELEAYEAQLDARERQLLKQEGDLSSSLQQYNNLGVACSPCPSAFALPFLLLPLAPAPCPSSFLYLCANV